MRFRKEHGVIVVLLLLILTVVGCAGQSANSDEESYTAQIMKWSNENLEQADNYTMIRDTVFLMLDEDGNELNRGEGSREIIVFYDPYKTKTTALPGTDYPKVPLYELHQNNAITTYYTYIPEDENYYMDKITKEEHSHPEYFEEYYIGDGERMVGLLAGMVDYEVIEDNEGQVVIEATIDPEAIYGASAEFIDISLFTQTIYYDVDRQNVEKMVMHEIRNIEDLPLEIEGKAVKTHDMTIITKYMDINTSPDFELPEVIEFSN